MPLTEFEAAVFRALQEDGRVAFTAVAQRLGVSEANVRRTVKQLIARDVFTITAVADPRLMGLESMAWLALAVQLSELEATAAALAEMPEIDYVVITTGAWHVMAEIACPGTDDLFALLQRVRSLPGVQRTETYPYFKLLRQQFRWTNGGDRPRSPEGGEARGVRSAPAGLDALDRVLIERAAERRARVVPRHRAADGRLRARDLDPLRAARRRGPGARDRGRQSACAGLPRARVARRLAERRSPTSTRSPSAFGRIPQVSYLVSVSGRFDLMGELVCRDRDHLLATLNDRVGAIEGVETVEVFFYLRLLYRNAAGAWGAARSRAVAGTDTAAEARGRASSR